MPRRRPFPYAERAERVRNAQRALNEAGRHPLFEGRDSALGAFWAALGSALPPEFDAALLRARSGDPNGADVLIAFLEADPIFFRSGYYKADAAQYLKRVPLTEPQQARLRAAILKVVSTRDGREFRRYCRLAQHLDAPAFRIELQQLAEAPDAATRRRAGWVLAALSLAP